MPIVSTVSSTRILPPNSFGGPFRTSFGFFVTVSAYPGGVTESGRAQVATSKDGINWLNSTVVLDSSSTPGTLDSIWCVQSSNIIYIVGQFSTGAVRTNYASIRSDGTVASGTGATVQAAATTGAPRGACCLVHRSTDELVVFFQGPAYTTMGTSYPQIYYSRSTDNGATWSAAVLVAGGTTDNFTGPVAAVGPGTIDLISIAYRYNTGVAFKRLSGTTLSAVTSTAVTMPSTTSSPFSSAISWTANSNFRSVYALATDGPLSWSQTLTAAGAYSSTSAAWIYGQPNIDGILDGGPRSNYTFNYESDDYRTYFAVAGTNGELRFARGLLNSNFTDYEAFGSIIPGTYQRVNCNVYNTPNGARVLGYITYDSGNVLHYGEEIIKSGEIVGEVGWGLPL